MFLVRLFREKQQLSHDGLAVDLQNQRNSALRNTRIQEGENCGIYSALFLPKARRVRASGKETFTGVTVKTPNPFRITCSEVGAFSDDVTDPWT